MNKLFLFIFCCCPIYLFAQSNEAHFTSNAHKSSIAARSGLDNYIYSIQLFGNNFFARSNKHKEIEKCSFKTGNIKSTIKHYPRFTIAIHRLSEKPAGNPPNQIAEINKKIKKIFHSSESAGIFSNNNGVSVIVGELSNVVEDGSVMPPPHPKVNKFLNSYPQNSLMGYLLGSVFTPSGFYIGLSVPVPYTKTGTYH